MKGENHKDLICEVVWINHYSEEKNGSKLNDQINNMIRIQNKYLWPQKKDLIN